MAKSNPIKQLAGETVIYGMSTILARVVNFMLVPLYTHVLTQSDYGIITELMAYIAILQVFLALGLETGCFRYASKEGAEPKKVFSTAFTIVTLLSALFATLAVVFSNPIASAMGYPGFSTVIIFAALTPCIDSITAILFARLRHEGKAIKFAIIRTLKIFIELGINLLLYLCLPSYISVHPDTVLLRFVSATPDFTYAIFAIFISCIGCLLMLIPEILRLTFKIERSTALALLSYSLPLMIAGLPGVMNDFIDRILMRFINADPVMWRADLGVYQAGVKIAVIMQLFVQMFRYAAEPFFFRREKEKNNKELYAKVMSYFVAFCMLGFLAVMLYIDEIGMMLGRDFRQGLEITPIMLMAYVMLGMQFNISMWYKLSGKTGYAVWITFAGLVVTILINTIFMPIYSYHAAAWGHVASYVVMMVISLHYGKKYYPIPYRWKQIIGCIVLAIAIFGISLLLPDMNPWVRRAIHTLLLICYLAPVGLYFYRKQ